MAIQLPGGLAQMLGKVLAKPEGGKAGASPAAPAVGGVPAAPAVPAVAAGPVKGAPIGEGVVLHGVGYSEADRTAPVMKVHEKDTVARFLKDPEVEKFLGRSAREPEVPREERAAEAHKAELRREERADEQKVQVAREAQREEAQRDQAHDKERERHRERHQQDEEEGQPQWTGDEPPREEADERPEGPYDEDPLGETYRCKGEHEGVRCLRRPLEGTAYCRAHMITPLNDPPTP